MHPMTTNLPLSTHTRLSGDKPRRRLFMGEQDVPGRLYSDDLSGQHIFIPVNIFQSAAWDDPSKEKQSRPENFAGITPPYLIVVLVG